MFSESLWGEFFEVPDSKEQTKKILEKTKKPRKEVEMTADKAIKSKKVTTEEKVRVITENVNKVLGKQADNISVIYGKDEFLSYIDAGIASGAMAVDTETNNSLDPLTCKLMGLCLYYPGGKQAYIPVNHVGKDGVRLPRQLTEEDIKEGLKRLVDAKTYILMHNAKFDYQVLKCTCGIEVKADWDTLIASQLINENESASLKEQYILHIDPSQEKYSINHLFDKMEYAVFPPEVFALYAATDSLMTYKLYEYQRPIMESDDFKRIRRLFLDVEMPCVWAIASMELTGVELDMEYDRRLSVKYHKLLDDVTKHASEELARLKPQIDAWRLTPAANKKEDGKKSKSEQLEDPVNMGSPTQLAILLYDIMGAPVVNPKKPRGTGDDEIKDILARTGFPICSVLRDMREVTKLITTYIDKLPETTNVDGRIHCHFNQYGAATGRASSSDPNLQNIPSHNKEIRMLFKASTPEKDIRCENNVYKVSKYSDLLINNEWVPAKNLTVGEILTTNEDTTDIVTGIEELGDYIYIYVK